MQTTPYAPSVHRKDGYYGTGVLRVSMILHLMDFVYSIAHIPSTTDYLLNSYNSHRTELIRSYV